MSGTVGGEGRKLGARSTGQDDAGGGGWGGKPTSQRDPAETPSGTGAACWGHLTGRARPGAPCRTWGWAGDRGAPRRGGVSARGRWSPLTSQLPSLPPRALLLPTKVVLTLSWSDAACHRPPPLLPGNLRPSHAVTGHSKSHLAAAFPWGLADTQWSLGRSWPRCQWAGTLGPRLEIPTGLI